MRAVRTGAPHFALHAPDADIARYANRYKDGWDELRAERRKRMIELGVVVGPRAVSRSPQANRAA